MERQNYLAYRNVIPTEDFSKESIPLLTTVDNWHKNNNGDLGIDDFCNLFLSHVGYNTEANRQMLEAFADKPVLESTKVLLESFITNKLCEEISVSAYEVTEGKKSLEHLNDLMDKLRKPVTNVELVFVSSNPHDLIDYINNGKGLRWRLKTLNRMLGSIRQGDFIFIFARPETGKTTLLASEVSHMLTQLSDDAGPIVWFNNEEQGSKVFIRVVQAYFGITHTEWLKDYVGYTERFNQETKGKFKLVDNAVLDKFTVQKYVETLQPSLILFDQLDKINGFKEDREDLRLGAIYQWAREIAKRFCAVIGVCQADGTAEGQEYLSMAHVSNSKTSKSAEADAIVGLGYKNQPGFEYVRGISVIKNKLVGDPDTEAALRHGKMQVLIKPSIARYQDIEQ